VNLLATIYPHDVDPTAPKFDYAAFQPRPAVRAVIFDEERVALIQVTKSRYYMLPGGGVEGEALRPALAREIQEELGCMVAVEREIGTIVVYIDRWQNKQIDTCFIARKTGGTGSRALTDFETTEDFRAVWAANVAEAIALVRKARPADRDGKLVQARDLLFLESV
jgi:8-oxo-dGTP pyrophosphatase MutT (NUDIX family)